MMSAQAHEKREAALRFYLYYKGWTDFLAGKDEHPPPHWKLEDRRLYSQGFEAAARAAEELRRA